MGGVLGGLGGLTGGLTSGIAGGAPNRVHGSEDIPRGDLQPVQGHGGWVHQSGEHDLCPLHQCHHHPGEGQQWHSQGCSCGTGGEVLCQ